MRTGGDPIDTDPSLLCTCERCYSYRRYRLIRTRQMPMLYVEHARSCVGCRKIIWSLEDASHEICYALIDEKSDLVVTLSPGLVEMLEEEGYGRSQT